MSSVPGWIFQRQCIALLVKVQLLQETHAQQDLVTLCPRVDAGPHRAETEFTQANFVDDCLPGADSPVGGLVQQRLPLLQAELFRYRQRYRHIRRTGIQHEHHRL